MTLIWFKHTPFWSEVSCSTIIPLSVWTRCCHQLCSYFQVLLNAIKCLTSWTQTVSQYVLLLITSTYFCRFALKLRQPSFSLIYWLLIHFLSDTDIRHPEELSLLRPVEEKKKKKDKDLTEEIYDLTEVPLSSGTLTAFLFSLIAWRAHVIAWSKNMWMLETFAKGFKTFWNTRSTISFTVRVSSVLFYFNTLWSWDNCCIFG